MTTSLAVPAALFCLVFGWIINVLFRRRTDIELSAKPRSYEQLSKLAKSNCDRSHQAALAGIKMRRESEMDVLLQGSARRGLDHGLISPTFTQKAAAPGDNRGETNADCLVKKKLAGEALVYLLLILSGSMSALRAYARY